jgi:archaemetzincin
MTIQLKKNSAILKKSIMKPTSRIPPPNTHHHELEIISSQISQEDIHLIRNALTYTYGTITKVLIGGERELPPDAYTHQRDQYDAELLLRYLLSTKKKELAVWVIPKDLYTQDMNFIFGLAQYLRGAMLSIFRLSTKELREKEAIHEVGHIFGLTHCTNRCVMQYSNSLGEAQHKPDSLCQTCTARLNI